ncbi:serine/threonine-protein kinase [Dokdonella sp.]|uniref:serine/threonine-protein kinase n=1 Tax=Dokdonella sp. TaxID=2291710 RepID=UPI0025C1E2D6|nr:serine/threonine-protein kinase [Dokdonella sp.]MBX3690719.1 serine/threonine protein kinase [Dokdonella sp.]MCW5566862.1 serine/threonine protein kinase [Dokdonella sp.]
MSRDTHAATVRRLFGAVRDLPATARHARLLELGADPLLIAEVDAWLAADAATSALGSPVPGAGIGSSELGVGDVLGAWRLVDELGVGGMGAVYLAERADGHFDQRAAIKLIRGIPSPETFVHFARERQILATLQHPNIARLLDGGATPGGQPYFVMEHVDGVPIDRYCREQALGLAARLALFIDVCKAVEFAHSRFIVHCDLKPSNVLVRADGVPILLDFGVARALDAGATVEEQRAASAWVTPRYASPEQLRRETVSTASDVYSLGLILFELIACRRARLDADDHTITLLGQAIARPSALARDVPWAGRLRGDLDAIVQRATAHAAEARYVSARALADDIERHRAHRPVLARPQTVSYRASRLLRRRWPVAAVAMLLIALAGMFTWRLAAERDRALVAEREATVQANTAAQVSEFLVSVFNVSNPKLRQRRDLSARDVLDEGAKRIENELGDAPRVKAHLLDVLGNAYRSIGEPARTVELFRQAIALHLDPRVDDPLAAAATLSQLAVVYSNNKFPASEAEAAARESLRLREAHAAPDSLDMADALNTLGIILEQGGHADQAEPLLRRSLAIRTRELGADSLNVASTLHNLGLVASSRGDNAGAVELYRQALAIKRARVGEHHPEYQSSLDNYANALGQVGRHDEALAILRENVTLAHELYGDASEHLAVGYNELGSQLHDLGRFADAAVEYREALAVHGRMEGDGQRNASRALPLNNLASAYEDMGDLVAALPLFRESLALRLRTQDPDSSIVLRAEYNLARAATKAGRHDEAAGPLEHVLAEYRRRFGEANFQTAKAEAVAIEGLLGRQRLGEAQALRAAMAEPASEHRTWRLLLARTDARLALARSDTAAARNAAREAWELSRAQWGESHPLIVEAGVLYATALARSGEADEARELVAQLRPIADAAFVEGAPLRSRLDTWR